MIYLRIGVTKTTELLLNRLSGKKTVLSYLKLEIGEKRIIFSNRLFQSETRTARALNSFRKLLNFSRNFRMSPHLNRLPKNCE